MSLVTALRRISILCLAFLCICTGVHAAHAQTIAIPSTPAGNTLRAFLDAFNSGERTKFDAYIKSYNPSDTADDLVSFAGQTGGFTLLSIESSTPAAITFLVKGRSDHTDAFGYFNLASTEPPKVASWDIRAIPPGATFENITLDAAARQRTLDAISARLTEMYVYPDMAAKMDQALADHAKRGDYNALTDGNSFAAAVLKDLRAVSNDKHLFVDYVPYKLPAEPDDGHPHPPSPADLERQRSRLERDNCLFRKVEVLPNNIGYVKFDAFMNPQMCGATVASAMGFLAHTDAVIVDLRQNGGGSPAMVQLIASYFFDHSTHLNDLYDRHEDTTTQYWTLPYVPGPRITAPLFILTSSRTFSGAEEFSYDMQTQKRATIVGETTGGGAHPVRGVSAGDHFTIGVPFARPINPVTKKDWEGTGITPDHKVVAADALTSAQQLAIEQLRSKP